MEHSLLGVIGDIPQLSIPRICLLRSQGMWTGLVGMGTVAGLWDTASWGSHLGATRVPEGTSRILFGGLIGLGSTRGDSTWRSQWVSPHPWDSAWVLGSTGRAGERKDLGFPLCSHWGWELSVLAASYWSPIGTDGARRCPGQESYCNQPPLSIPIPAQAVGPVP